MIKTVSTINHVTMGARERNPIFNKYLVEFGEKDGVKGNICRHHYIIRARANGRALVKAGEPAWFYVSKDHLCDLRDQHMKVAHDCFDYLAELLVDFESLDDKIAQAQANAKELRSFLKNRLG